jgi:hypothetical protein
MQVSEQVKRVMTKEKISHGKLEEMVASAAISSVPGFNRRYYNWLLKVTGDQVMALELVNRPIVGSGETVMYEVHEDCEGQGCKKCGWSGEIGRRVTDKPLPKHEPLFLDHLTNRK